MNISIKQLQAFREVLRTGSVTEAAKQLNRTQPAISALIGNLEKELGIELFERQPGKLIRKPEAKYFFKETEAILEHLVQFARTMKEVGNLQEGRLRIACMSSSALLVIPRLVSGFVQDKPKVKVSIMVRSSAVIEEWVASQQYDIGLSETPALNSALIMKTFDLHCICAMRHDDPLAQKDFIRPEDLDNKPLATPNEGHPSLIAMREVFRSAGARFNSRFELRNFQPGLRLVEDGLCYCICDPMTASSYIEDHRTESPLVFKSLFPVIPLTVSILQPAHRPPSLLAAAFVKILEEKLKTMNETFKLENL